ncbi:hypothetical protein PG999_010591 [Apiospora kogelbergensis]|uniref:Uncharacterized protein n=1 Tax=Apiospora kogelbergensis TaxID=1337665 RepID=A0AAW0QC50_9PEZI
MVKRGDADNLGSKNSQESPPKPAQTPGLVRLRGDGRLEQPAKSRWKWQRLVAAVKFQFGRRDNGDDTEIVGVSSHQCCVARPDEPNNDDDDDLVVVLFRSRGRGHKGGLVPTKPSARQTRQRAQVQSNWIEVGPGVSAVILQRSNDGSARTFLARCCATLQSSIFYRPSKACLDRIHSIQSKEDGVLESSLYRYLHLKYLRIENEVDAV